MQMRGCRVCLFLSYGAVRPRLSEHVADEPVLDSSAPSKIGKA